MVRTGDDRRRRPPDRPAVPMRFPERALLLGTRAGLALVLLTPLVTAPFTFYPFSVGKAVYARSVIAAAFVLWAALALARPRWRVPPGALLGVLGAGLAVAAIAAWLGVSPQRSLWSTYTRMEGLVDTAHWFAFVAMLAGVARRTRDWERLFNVNLAVGLAVAAIAAVRFYVPDAPILGLEPETRHPRIGATTGNPTYLGAYLQAIALLAAGFLVRSFVAPPAGHAATARPGARRARRRSRSDARPPRGPAAKVWPARLFWALTASSALFGLALSGSLGALAGLGAGAFAAAALYAWLGRTPRARRLGAGALGGLAAAVLALAVLVAVRPAAAPVDDAPPVLGSVLLERATRAERIAAPLARRLRNWEAGLRAFAERPVLGWGPHNYHVASARYLSPPDGRALVRDHPHNMLIEEAATKGLAGLALYLALWGLTLRAIVRAARVAAVREQALIVFAGAALAGWFVQSQSLFYSPSIWLQHMLLLGFAVHLEATARAPRRPWRARFGRWRAAPWLGAAAAAVLGVGSLATSHAIYTGAAAIHRAEYSGPFLEELERSMRAFEPLANGPRVLLFNNLAANWPVLAAGHAPEAQRLLAWANAEAPAALAAEPESWVLHHALARLYRAVAATRPDYAAPAQRHLDRSLALAPNLDPLEAPGVSGQAP